MKEIHERSLTQRMQRRHATCPRAHAIARVHVSGCAPRVHVSTVCFPTRVNPFVHVSTVCSPPRINPVVHVSTVCSPPRVNPIVHVSIEAEAEPAQRVRARGDAATCQHDEQPHDATWTRALDATWTRALDAKVTRVLVTRRRVT